jgi:hypothetical protein
VNATFAHTPLHRADAALVQMHARARDGLPTGWSQLDALLPGGGWPAGGLTEMLHAHGSVEAMSLLLPALAALTHAARRVVLIEPPSLPALQNLRQHGLRSEFLHVIKSEAQADSWSAEQHLRTGCAAAVVLWAHPQDAPRLRGLQQAAAAGASHALVIRDIDQAQQISPADLRVAVTRDERGIVVNVLRCRGLHKPAMVVLPVANNY